MTDCSNVEMRESLPDLLHERLDAASRTGVLAHVATCESCAAELELLRQARHVMARAPEVDVARIAAALSRPRATPPLRVARGGTARAGVPVFPVGAARALSWRRWAVAAGLLLAAGLSGVTMLRPDGTASSGASDAAIARAPAAAPAPAAAGGAAADPLLAVNVEGLTDDDLAGLLDGLEDLDALPASDPMPVVRVERDESGGD